jgi:hypothetical protein
MTGCTPAFNAATSASNTSGEMPDPPTPSITARANMVARTVSTGSGSPTAPLRPATSCCWKAAASLVNGVRRLAPSPVFSP